MSKAFLDLKAEVLADDFTVREWFCFKHGFEAAMKFMSSPRVPAPSTGPSLPTTPTTGEPIPLVAFYTDAP